MKQDQEILNFEVLSELWWIKIKPVNKKILKLFFKNKDQTETNWWEVSLKDLILRYYN